MANVSGKRVRKASATWRGVADSSRATAAISPSSGNPSNGL